MCGGSITSFIPVLTRRTPCLYLPCVQPHKPQGIIVQEAREARQVSRAEVHLSAHAFTHVRMCVCVCVSTCLYVFVCIHASIVCVCAREHSGLCVCVCSAGPSLGRRMHGGMYAGHGRVYNHLNACICTRLSPCNLALSGGSYRCRPALLGVNARHGGPFHRQESRRRAALSRACSESRFR